MERVASQGILTIDFWDVGQGDCTVITKPDGSLIIIDVGPRNSPLIDWLRDHPRKRISDVILTHNDSDHIGAIPALLEARSVGSWNVWLLQDGPRTGRRQQAVVKLLTPLKRAEVEGIIQVRGITKGTTIWTDPHTGSYLDIIYPSELDKVLSHESPNLGSAILALMHPKGKMVIWPGDNTVRRTLEERPHGMLHTLFGPHHGGPEDRTRSSRKTFEKETHEIAAENAQISVGKNSYDHPNLRYLTYLRKAGCQISCTGLTRLCDRRIKTRKAGHHIMNGSALLGLRRTSTGFACRGAKRLTITSEGIFPDKYEATHREAVQALTHPYCMPRETWSKKRPQITQPPS